MRKPWSPSANVCTGTHKSYDEHNSDQLQNQSLDVYYNVVVLSEASLLVNQQPPYLTTASARQGRQERLLAGKALESACRLKVGLVSDQCVELVCKLI